MALGDRFPPDRAARVYAGFLTFADPNVFCTTLLGRFLVDRPLFLFRTDQSRKNDPAPMIP